ncbi:MAG: hypothetical protein IT365_24795 [Candidatus Hydrogenedentes bacterium]|nr:hypothetical protein [Candidatus Hydrogenedentota bacterium]
MSSLTEENESVLLVDYENVQKVDLSGLPASALVKIFVGDSQKSVPFELAKQAQDLGSRLEWIKIAGNGSNALDFHIAFYLGKEITRLPAADYIILTRDKGFDPLIRHLTTQGISCRRVNNQQELAAAEVAYADPNFKKVYDNLTKIEKRGRPRKRTTLTRNIAAMFQKRLTDAEVEALVEMLFTEKLVTEANKVLSYHF